MTIKLVTVRTVLSFALIGSLSGCGYLFGDDGLFRSSAQDYKTAPELDPVQVPEGKSRKRLQELYAIPRIEDDLVLVGEFEVPRPAPLVAGAVDQMVRIQRLGDDSWALITAPPGQVWPQVRGFIDAMGLQTARLDARQGVMETSWVTLQDQAMASRFRFRIEQGVQRGNSELHVLQMNQAGDIGRWPASSDDLQQETDMLQSISQYIANSGDDAAPVSMIAEQAIRASGRIALQEDPAGYTYIQLELPFDRAWASVDKALLASTFEITDRNRSVGEYYVTFLGPQEEDDGGWFDWMFDGEQHPMAGRKFLVTMTPLSEESVKVRLQPQDGDPLEQREEQSLLALLKGGVN